MALHKTCFDCKFIFNDFLYHRVNGGLDCAANRILICKRRAQLTPDQFEHGAKAAQKFLVCD